MCKTTDDKTHLIVVMHSFAAVPLSCEEKWYKICCLVLSRYHCYVGTIKIHYILKATKTVERK